MDSQFASRGSSNGSRRCLVVLRAGDDSLHRAWIDAIAPDQRLWDLHLSYYGASSDPLTGHPPDVTLSQEFGPSFVGLAQCFEKAPFRRPVESYDWIWLPDDDLLTDQRTIDAFFSHVMKYDLKLAQPALHEDSHVAHLITVRHTNSLLRFTNFVEVMCPCFSRRTLQLCLPYFRETKSSWGLDFLFPKLLGYPPRSIAVVDATPVIHTRAIRTGAHYERIRETGEEPYSELSNLVARFDISVRLKNNLAVVRPDGSITEDLDGVVPVRVDSSMS